jgi:3-methyl-2-oxobutanoate hydroxymethyltransferase
MSDLWTAPRIRALKGQGKIACLTAADFFAARVLDEAGLPMILVGDSLGMTTLGHATTLPVTLADMLHHTAAVARGVKNALVVTDLPFLTYQVSPAQALESAGRCLQAGAGGGQAGGAGVIRADTVRLLVDNGIPVLGHIGLLPQSVRGMGGYKVQGRTASDVDRLLADAAALEEAGCFATVVEGVPAETAQRITAAIRIPTIGIGGRRGLRWPGAGAQRRAGIDPGQFAPSLSNATPTSARPCGRPLQPIGRTWSRGPSPGRNTPTADQAAEGRSACTERMRAPLIHADLC